MFYIKCKDIEERTDLIKHLAANEILAVFHYIPLHTAPAGKSLGRFNGIDEYTTKESERLVRLPMYYGLKPEQVDLICDKVTEFYA
jgi:dTDP-4-amino-4,6-dideoxygalactose transaminase